MSANDEHRWILDQLRPSCLETVVASLQRRYRILDDQEIHDCIMRAAGELGRDPRTRTMESEELCRMLHNRSELRCQTAASNKRNSPLRFISEMGPTEPAGHTPAADEQFDLNDRRHMQARVAYTILRTLSEDLESRGKFTEREVFERSLNPSSQDSAEPMELDPDQYAGILHGVRKKLLELRRSIDRNGTVFATLTGAESRSGKPKPWPGPHIPLRPLEIPKDTSFPRWESAFAWVKANTDWFCPSPNRLAAIKDRNATPDRDVAYHVHECPRCAEALRGKV